jgi:vancomycin resistance protein YoaR
MTTVTLPRRILRPMATPPARRSMLIGFVATLAVGLLALAGVSLAVGIAAEGTVHSGVTVGGVSVAGLDRAAAEARLDAELPRLDTGSATVVADGVESTASYADLGRGYEMEAMLDAAFGVGRADGPLGDAITRLRTLVHPSELPVIVHAYEPETLDRIAGEIARAVSTHPVEAHVDRATYEVHPASDGRLLEAAAVRDALSGPLAGPSPDDVRIEIATAVVQPIVSTEEAAAAAADVRLAVGELALVVPGAATDEEPLALTAGEISAWITFGPVGDQDYAMRVDPGAARATVAALAASVDRDPVNARITVAGGGLGGVVPGQDGRVLDVEATTGDLLAVLADRVEGTAVASMPLVVGLTEPALTTATAQAALPQMRLVSGWTTYYVPGEGNGFGNNISIGAWDLDGYNIAPGEWFSFWNGIGPVTAERGYRYGGAIINGRSVANGALGGGICSTSTTLFNAAMRFGLEIGERTAHYYYINRYPTGLDATVAIVDSSVTDMTFRNDTEHPIVIRGYGSPGQVTFQIWSVPTGRSVVLSDPYITDRRSAIETTQLDTSMAPGTARRVEFPHDGFKATVSRTVYGPDGGVVHQNTWFSDYRTVNGITLVGPTPAPAPEPPPADDEPPPGEEA